MNETLWNKTHPYRVRVHLTPTDKKGVVLRFKNKAESKTYIALEKAHKVKHLGHFHPKKRRSQRQGFAFNLWR